MTKNINVAIVGSMELFKSLAKQSTESDLLLGNHYSQDGIFTFVYPKAYPEKLSSLLQALALCDTVVFAVGNVDAALGEQIVALSSFDGKRGMIVGKEIIEEFIKDTPLQNWPSVEKDKVREELLKLEEMKRDGPAKVVIDHYFPVKGVGTVVLGIVQRGKIEAHQKVIVEPNPDWHRNAVAFDADLPPKEIEIKSIQMQDEDTKEAPCPARVGLALKGIEAPELSRGMMLCERGSVKTGKEFKIDFKKTKFYKSEIREGEVFQCFFGLQMAPGRVKSMQHFVVETEKPVAYETGDNVIVTKPDAKGLRIVGNGKII